MNVRKQVYADFNKNWNKMLPTIKGGKPLAEQASQLDAVVAGSDQLLWPSNIVLCYFTLEFVPDNVKKIAFSTSFCVPELQMKTACKQISVTHRRIHCARE